MRGRNGEITEDEFYADPKRKLSPEVDFGVGWTAGPSTWPQYRVSWVVDTGEWYAVRHTDRMVFILGRTEPNNREQAEEALEGWAEHDKFDVQWVTRRLEAYR